ncbi:hypothetical protein [Caballeronia sp. ATUFL_F2_KS9A]|uniref:hypothetical protein n=1 Tax=Caballeronia sp. ATUFL_F2_KS9A TaxID=2921777 RepID=UPI0020283FFE|nr:hypothetical protein [Caballeronia sp. ATUFL_F2_KS9A]
MARHQDKLQLGRDDPALAFGVARLYFNDISSISLVFPALAHENAADGLGCTDSESRALGVRRQGSAEEHARV